MRLFAVIAMICIPLIFIGCQPARPEAVRIPAEPPQEKPVSLIVAEGSTVAARFKPPKDFERSMGAEGSFPAYLQNLPLKPDGSPVLLYDGSEKQANIHAAVVAMDIGNQDLQQCADAVIRLRAEYLYHTGMLDQISFRFTNGFPADFKKWRSGQRIEVKGNLAQWVGGGKASDDYENLRKYLNKVFAYAGTRSLANELQPAALENLKAGDVFIQGGSPGHCVIVVDMAVNPAGEKRFMLAQSYMPAQEIHILKNLNTPEESPWYTAQDSSELITPQWTFRWEDLKSW